MAKSSIFESVLKEKQAALKATKEKSKAEEKQIQKKKNQILAKIATLQSWFEQLLIQEPKFKEYLDCLLASKHYQEGGNTDIYVAGTCRRRYKNEKNGSYSDIVISLFAVDKKHYEYRLKLWYNDVYDDDRNGYYDPFSYTGNNNFSKNMAELEKLDQAIEAAIEKGKNATDLMNKVIDDNHFYLENQ